MSRRAEPPLWRLDAGRPSIDGEATDVPEVVDVDAETRRIVVELSPDRWPPRPTSNSGNG